MPRSRSQFCQAHASASAVASRPTSGPYAATRARRKRGSTSATKSSKSARSGSAVPTDTTSTSKKASDDPIVSQRPVRSGRTGSQHKGEQMSGWHFADVWEVVAENLPDAPAQVQGDRRITWGEMDLRADGVAKVLLEGGAGRQDKVAQYLYNCPEYMESMFAVFKAGLAPVNTNYRYADDELVYLWDNADAVAVVFHGCFAERCDRVRDRVPSVQTWLWVDDGSGPCPDWAIEYEKAASSATERTVPSHGRGGDDLLLLYTGGTTGMPKGVMWQLDDLFVYLNPPSGVDFGVEADRDKVRGMSVAPGRAIVPAAPLMHGTGMFTALSAMTSGGCVVTLEGRSFDSTELLDTIERESINAIAWVGDAFAK